MAFLEKRYQKDFQYYLELQSLQVLSLAVTMMNPVLIVLLSAPMIVRPLVMEDVQKPVVALVKDPRPHHALAVQPLALQDALRTALLLVVRVARLVVLDIAVLVVHPDAPEPVTVIAPRVVQIHVLDNAQNPVIIVARGKDQPIVINVQKVVIMIAQQHVLAIALENVVVLPVVASVQILAIEDFATAVARALAKLHVVEDALQLVTEHVNTTQNRMTTIKEQKDSWKSGSAKSITFIVTKDCQLACKYCYLVGKNADERMSWEIAKSAIDYILTRENEFTEESVVWDFIGGEPFLEIDLIDKICDYIKIELYKKNHHWFNSYRFNFSTNGINYDSLKVQNFIRKNRDHLSIGITIDGTKLKHDLNRVYKGINTGSYDDVARNIPLWLHQFPGASTKVTISSPDIPYIKESVLHLFSLGIREVNINCVFENVWNENDDELFEDQLIQLADAIIEHRYFENYVCSLFSERIGKPIDTKDNSNWCGAGKMLSIDAHGNFYPCTRFAAYSLRSKKPIIIGNVETGIDANKLRPFLTLDRTTQSPQMCLNCEVASGCAWCQGENYDAAETSTIYQRSTAICKMHKARVRANNYYWNKLFRTLELEGKREEFEKSKRISQIEPC